MLTCLPQSLCSWNYQIQGLASGLPGTVTFDYFTEQGGIALCGEEFAIRKQGWLSGQWKLERGGVAVAEALKPNPLFRSFEITAGTWQMTVQAANPLGRSFQIMAEGRLLGTIEPVHPFTRRALIECDASVPERLQLFSFWLAAMTWKRANKN